jgi:hypothetical protein
MEDGCRGDVDALGDFGVAMTEELHPEQSTGGLPVAGVAHGDAVAVRVVRLVVVRLVADGHRVEAGGDRLAVAQTGARHHHVEDLDDLGAEAPGELALAAEGVLASDPPLLVGGGPERQVGGTQKAVVSHHTISCGQHVGKVGPHPAVDRYGSFRSQLGPSGGGELGIGPDPHHHQDQVGEDAGRSLLALRPYLQATGGPGGRAQDGANPGAAADLDAVLDELGADQAAQLRVDGGEDLGQLLDLGDREPPRDQGLRHLQPDVAGPDDRRPRRCGVPEGSHHREGVVHSQARVVADNIAATIQGRRATASFDGHGGCFIDTGFGKAGYGSGDFYAEPSPKVSIRPPARRWHLAKVAFEYNVMWRLR